MKERKYIAGHDKAERLYSGMTVSTGSIMNCIELKPLEAEELNRFVQDNQEAFNFGALEEFGLRDNHFEEDE